MFPSFSTIILSLVGLHLGLSSAAPGIYPWMMERSSYNDASPLCPTNKNATILTINDEFYGLRNVTYFDGHNGLAVIDGDVIYGPVASLLANQVHGNGTYSNGTLSNGTESHYKRAFSVKNTWPDAKIRYKFTSDQVQTTLQAIIDDAINRWHAGAPYITFERVFPNSADGMAGVLTIAANDCGGCNANIGYYPNSALWMNLQQGCSNIGGWCGASEAAHEFGHVLGLLHEHQRPNREGTVHFQCENLNPTCPNGVTMPPGVTCCSGAAIPAGCCGNLGNFNVLTAPNLDSRGIYDVNSIMEYRADAFALPGTLTITPVNPNVIVPASNVANPDTIDFNRVCKMYGGNCPKAIECRNLGCPTSCRPTLKCTNNPRCHSEFPPDCCFPGVDEGDLSCAAKKLQCARKGCGFLNA
ncbi:zincin [Lophium mytilinum]|uniref:Zincin n=1 Tax=Lophium mytilinum TaxID=390894 RepID=A0A6A6R868_9PEZI|nr:zincin [Lophium mytilinum]